MSVCNGESPDLSEFAGPFLGLVKGQERRLVPSMVDGRLRSALVALHGMLKNFSDPAQRRAKDSVAS
jgi:hypothetical protein